VTNMDEKGFIRYLKDKGKKPKYLSHVATVERYLSANFGKSLEEANENDIRACTVLTSNPPYAFGVKAYYQYLDSPNAKEIIKTIDTEIIPKLPKSQPPKSIRWTEFRNRMKQVEKMNISARNRALLNILWSRMKFKQIRHLRISDINFEKKVITTRPPDPKTYRVTPEAWEALKNYIPSERRGERKQLFPTVTSDRAVQTITKKYFDIMKITPHGLWLSCEKDLYEAGKQMRFSVLDKKPSSRIEKPPKKKQKRRLFLRIVEAIENFGSNNHHRMSTIKDEEEFQRILEGYLLATFPDETITPELYYKGYDETNSRIDFAVGKAPKIPIELKFARGNIRDDLAEGSGQVKEFLKSSGSKKGILAILSKDRGRVYERARKFNGLQNGDVHVVMI